MNIWTVCLSVWKLKYKRSPSTIDAIPFVSLNFNWNCESSATKDQLARFFSHLLLLWNIGWWCACGVVCLVQTVNNVIVLSGSWMRRLYCRFDVCLCWIYSGVTESAFVFENIVCFDMKQSFNGVQWCYPCMNVTMIKCCFAYLTHRNVDE